MKYGKMMGVAIVALAMLVVGAFGANTNDITRGGTSGYHGGEGTVILEGSYDFSVVTGDVSEIYQMINIPANTYVMAVGYHIEANADGVKGETGTCTVDIGDRADTDGWIDGANCTTGQASTAYCYWPTTANGTIGTNATRTITTETGINGAYIGVGKFYSAASTVDLLPNNGLDTLKITVRALCVPAGGL